MGRSPCCDADANVKKGPWTPEEDEKLRDYIEKNGHGSWRHLPKLAGLNRCGKSCRLRWANYLRPDIKRGRFSEEEEQFIIQLHSTLGNKWSAIAGRLPGRTDNEIKNYWNTHLRKKLLNMGIDPVTHRPRTDLNLLAGLPYNLIAAANLMTNLPKLQLLQTIFQVMSNNSPPNLDAMSTLLGSPFLGGGTALGLQNPNLLAAQHLIVPPPMNYGCSSAEQGVESNGGTANSTAPSLVSSPADYGTVDQVQDHANSAAAAAADISGVSSPTSTPMGVWDGLTLEGLDSDLGWKDILDQISWSDELQS